ncbi:MAG: nuclear transport factor 2 family protein [Pseudomonadota bacterium]
MQHRLRITFSAGLLAVFCTLVPFAPLHAQGVDETSLGVQGLSNSDAAGVKRQVEAWTEALHVRDYDSWKTFFAKDAVLAAPGHERIKGVNEIAAWAKKTMGISMTFSYNTWAIVGRDDLAVVTNSLIWRTEGVDARDASRFNQMIVLRKNADGDWLVQSVIFNSPVAQN